MTRNAKVSFWAVLFGLVTLPCYVWAASITEKRANIGYECEVTVDYATAMGYITTASGLGSTAMGNDTTASGLGSTAMGYYTTASGEASTAMGFGTIASGYRSTAMGSGTVANGSYSWSGGRQMRLTADAYHTFVWGYSSTARSISTADSFLIFPAGTAGKVGIGTAVPKYALHVHKNSSSYAYLSLTNTTTGSGSLDGVLVGLDPNEDFRIHSYESNNLLFFIDNDEKVRIASSGNVGINETNPTKKLYVNGSAGGTQAWNASDKREKTEIKTIKYALDNVSKLRGVAYKWKKGDEDESKGFDNKTHFGVIAQEVEQIYPELVDNPGDTEQRKHVEYNALVGILIEAVKELKVQNDDQKAEIEELRAMIKELKS